MVMAHYSDAYSPSCVIGHEVCMMKYHTDHSSHAYLYHYYLNADKSIAVTDHHMNHTACVLD